MRLSTKRNGLTGARPHASEGGESPLVEVNEGYREVIAPHVENEGVSDADRFPFASNIQPSPTAEGAFSDEPDTETFVSV